MAETHDGRLKQRKNISARIYALEKAIQMLSSELERQEDWKKRVKLEKKNELVQELSIRKQILIKKIEENGRRKKMEK